MKKLLVVLVVAFSALALNAQNPGEGAPKGRPQFDPEKMAQFAAQKMAEELLLTDDAAADFIPVYKQYKKEFGEINAKYRPKKEEKPQARTDASIEAEIKANFDKSQEILDLRKAYYEKFSKVLSQRQIQQLYRIEKTIGEKAHGKFKDHGGKR